jgi:hypothetical protein
VCGHTRNTHPFPQGTATRTSSWSGSTLRIQFTLYSVELPTFCRVTVVVKYVSFTPNAVDMDAFSGAPA